VADSVLEKLRELQDVELQLRRLENSKSSHDRAAKVRLEQIEKQKEHIESLRNEHRQARMAADKKELEVRQKRVEIEDVRRKRDAAAKTLPPKVVDLFNRIAERLDGEALAEVIRDEDDEDGAYVCGGCHMSVTQNTYVLLASRNESLCTCPNCTRILYLKKT
jgi:predicted  nucleic acid-binding Zn-ribbon protein